MKFFAALILSLAALLAACEEGPSDQVTPVPEPTLTEAEAAGVIASIMDATPTTATGGDNLDHLSADVLSGIEILHPPLYGWDLGAFAEYKVGNIYENRHDDLAITLNNGFAPLGSEIAAGIQRSLGAESRSRGNYVMVFSVIFEFADQGLAEAYLAYEASGDYVLWADWDTLLGPGVDRSLSSLSEAKSLGDPYVNRAVYLRVKNLVVVQAVIVTDYSDNKEDLFVFIEDRGVISAEKIAMALGK